MTPEQEAEIREAFAYMGPRTQAGLNLKALAQGAGILVKERERQRDEYKKKYEHTEMERIHYKDESKSYQELSNKYFNELEKLKRESANETHNLRTVKDVFEKKWLEIAAINLHLRKALQRIAAGDVITASSVIAKEILQLKAENGEKILAAMEAVCLQARNVTQGYDMRHEVLGGLLEALDAAKKESTKGDSA